MTTVCAGCSTPYTVGLSACPNCGSSEVRAASVLPQMRVACRTDGCRAAGSVTVVPLASVAPNLVAVPALACALCGRQVQIVAAWEDNDMPKITRHGGATNALAGPPAPAPEPKEEVASSPGSSSQTSSAKDEPSPETKPAAPRKRARTTGSRSGKARTGSSTARGTGGGQTEAKSETG